MSAAADNTSTEDMPWPPYQGNAQARARTVNCPPSGVYFTALSNRLAKTWRTRAGSTQASQGVG